MTFNCSYTHYIKRQKQFLEFDMKTSQDRGWSCKINYLKFPKASSWLPKYQWYLKQDRILFNLPFISNPKLIQTNKVGECIENSLWLIQLPLSSSKHAGVSGKPDSSLETGSPLFISVTLICSSVICQASGHWTSVNKHKWLEVF